VGELPSEALKETDQAQRHVFKNRTECPSPNRKRPSTGLVESDVKEDGGRRDVEHSKPSLVTTSGARTGSSPSGQKVVQVQTTTLGEIPYGWKHVKLEPDC
jgi:hypothetical protein